MTNKNGVNIRVADEISDKLDKLLLDSQNLNAKEKNKKKRVVNETNFQNLSNIRNNYKASLTKLDEALFENMRNPSKESFLGRSAAVSAAYQSFYEASNKVAAELPGKGRETNEVRSLAGRDMQNFVVNRGFISNATNNFLNNPQSANGLSFDQMMLKASMIEVNMERESTSVLGSGAINEVLKLKDDEKDYASKKGALNATSTYATSTADKTFIEYQMYEKLGYISKDEHSKIKDADSGEYKTMNVDNALRDQGQSTVNKLLGYSAIADTRVGVNSQTGLTSVMDMAEGTKAADIKGFMNNSDKGAFDIRLKQMETDPDFKNEVENKITSRVGEKDRYGKPIMIDKLDENGKVIMGADNNPIKTQKQKEIKGYKGIAETKNHPIDLKDPSLQRACQELALNDLICGQLDRHAGNFFISGEPGNMKVTGIDNDYSFGMQSLKGISGGIEGEAGHMSFGGNAINVTKLERSFPLMTKDMAENIRRIDKDAFANALAGSVGMGDGGAERIDAVKNRIQEIKDYVTENQDKEGFLVDGYDNKTAKKLHEAGKEKTYVNGLLTPTSYSPYARVVDFAEQNFEKTMNYLSQTGDLAHEKLSKLSNQNKAKTAEKQSHPRANHKGAFSLKDEPKKEQISAEELDKFTETKQSAPKVQRPQLLAPPDQQNSAVNKPSEMISADQLTQTKPRFTMGDRKSQLISSQKKDELQNQNTSAEKKSNGRDMGGKN
ncbi:MAG: hypothetical protein LBC82_03940 [Oscillospiraceae bacterium]|nr:hypothetical protein [Oscillospiraceae bacterium]